MKLVLRAILVLSLGLNILFVYNRFGRPDVTMSKTSLEHAYVVGDISKDSSPLNTMAIAIRRNVELH